MQDLIEFDGLLQDIRSYRKYERVYWAEFLYGVFHGYRVGRCPVCSESFHALEHWLCWAVEALSAS